MSTYYTKARDFAVKYIDPVAKEIDEKEIFPAEVFKKLGEEGYFTLLIPSELGGQGKTIKEHAEICRALAKTCPIVELCYRMHNVGIMTVQASDNKNLISRICKDVIDNKKFLALAYSELGTGTHFNITTMDAVFNETSTTFKGVKSMVTSALHASYYVTSTVAKDAPESDVWVFPLGAKGLDFKPNTWHGLGMRGNVSCQMEINDVTLEKDEWFVESGARIIEKGSVDTRYFVLGLAAVYAGLCEAILDEALNHATSRKYPDGKALSEIETVQIHLSKIYASTNAAVLGVDEAVRSYLADEPDYLAKILAARMFSSEAAVENARLGMRIGGGKAYNRFGNMERYLRDSYASQIMAPSVDVLALWLGATITEK